MLRFALLFALLLLVACGSAPARTGPITRNSAPFTGEPEPAATAVPAPAPAPEALYRKSLAVVVGIDAYRTLPRLGGAVRDARKVGEVLAKHGFEVRLLLDGEASRDAITRVLGDELPERLGPDDRVVVFFAGHGVTKGDADAAMGYLMPVEGDRDAVASTGIAMSELQRWFALYRARHVLYLADACYSGLGLATRSIGLSPDVRDYLHQIASRRVRAALTAGAAGEEAHEWQGHGVFTYFLLEALQGAADANGDGLVTSDELGTYVKPRVGQTARREWNASQNPQSARQGEGEVVFVTPGSARGKRGAPAASGRPKLTQALAALGDPAAPPACACTDEVAAQLAEPARLLVGGRPGSAREADLRALTLAEAAWQAAPDCAEAAVLVARARLQAGMTAADVQQAAGAALGRCPGFAAAEHLVGSAHLLAGRHADAEAAFRRATAAAPAWSAPVFNLGLLALGRGDGASALGLFEVLAAREPERADVFLLLGHARAQLGRHDAAKEAWCRAKALGSPDAAPRCP